MAPLSVVLAAVKVGYSEYPRPCGLLAIDEQNNGIVLPVSSQMDLYRPNIDFLLDDSHPDFKATGLPKKSYVIAIEALRVAPAKIRKTYGQLQGKLASDFLVWLSSSPS